MKKITERDYIKANRKASRDEEIALYGRPLPKARLHKSKKNYDRNREKAACKKQPFDLPLPSVSGSFVSTGWNCVKYVLKRP